MCNLYLYNFFKVMQHNIQDMLRYGTHLLHTTQTVVKSAQKREIIQLNLNEIYQLECYENAMKSQLKQIDMEDDGIIVDAQQAFKINTISFYSQLDHAPNYLNPINSASLRHRKDSFFGETSNKEEDSGKNENQLASLSETLNDCMINQ